MTDHLMFFQSSCFTHKSYITEYIPVMSFPSRLILSSVAISVSFSGKMENLLLAKLMLVKCSISPTASGSLVRTLPRRSNSARYFKTRVNRGVASLFFHHSIKTFCQCLWSEQHVRWITHTTQTQNLLSLLMELATEWNSYSVDSHDVTYSTSQLSEGCKEFAGECLHLIVSQCD